MAHLGVMSAGEIGRDEALVYQRTREKPALRRPMGTPTWNVHNGRRGRLLRTIISSKRDSGRSSVYICVPIDHRQKFALDYEGWVVRFDARHRGMIVMDETVDIMESTKNLTEFYKHESCGWCTPCREGTDWLVKIFNRISTGGGREADAQLMLDICDNIEGKSFCALADAAAWPIQSAIKQFPEDFKKWWSTKRPQTAFTECFELVAVIYGAGTS